MIERKQSFRGFTLVELSAVLVIIGLIVGGIAYTSTLVGQSRMAGVITEAENFRTAFVTFKQKYNALPGDMAGAYANFDPSGTGTVCGTNAVVSTTATGCNGNGNSQIAESSVTNAWRETFRGWQHLQLEQLIPGNYSGVAGSTVRYDIMANIPTSAIEGMGYDLFSGTVQQVTGHFIRLGKSYNTTTLTGPALTPQDARAIDQKADDGLASYGTIVAADSTDPTKVTCTAASGGVEVYEAAEQNSPNCTLSFLLERTY